MVSGENTSGSIFTEVLNAQKDSKMSIFSHFSFSEIRIQITIDNILDSLKHST